MAKGGRYEVIAADAIWGGFPNEILAEDPEGNELLAALAAEISAPAPSAAGRQRLLAGLQHVGRFDRFKRVVGELLDLSSAAAGELLDRLHDPEVWSPGPVPGPWSTWWVQGGPRADNAIRGFLRMAAGEAFPHHAHLGEERVLVLQGSLLDSDGVVVQPGTVATMAEGTAHDFRVTPGGPDLLILTVAHEGLKMTGGPVLLHDGSVLPG